jgi:hypothetical protein
LNLGIGIGTPKCLLFGRHTIWNRKLSSIPLVLVMEIILGNASRRTSDADARHFPRGHARPYFFFSGNRSLIPIHSFPPVPIHLRRISSPRHLLPPCARRGWASCDGHGLRRGAPLCRMLRLPLTHRRWPRARSFHGRWPPPGSSSRGGGGDRDSPVSSRRAALRCRRGGRRIHSPVRSPRHHHMRADA